MSMFSKFMHPERGYDKAQKALQPYFQMSQAFQLPAFMHGEQAFDKLSPAMDALLNPEQLTSKWVDSYQESPSAKMAEEMASQRGMDAASSLGLLRSTPALNALQTGTTNIALADRENYLNRLMQQYLAGAGIAGDIYGKGTNAATNLGQGAMNMGQNMAQLEYGKESAQGDLFSKLLGTGAGIVGGALGGPLGGALAKGLTQKMGWSTVGGQ